MRISAASRPCSTKHCFLVSGNAPVALIDRQLATPSRRRSARVAASFEELREALRIFGSARYGRSDELDTTKLDEALDAGIGAARRLRIASALPIGAKRTFARAAAVAGAVVWLR